MIAVDTNIIVRLIVADDEAQVARALALAERENFFVGLTVLIETDWVLRSRYGFDRGRVTNALLALADLVSITFESEADVRWAIERYALGGEFADFIHLAAARPIGRFASFEDKLARRAGDDTPAAVLIP
jgi:predicted nucleic-acid-binding protein